MHRYANPVAILLLTVMVLLAGCKDTAREQCEQLPCLQGTCDEAGKCNCDPGYEGENCGIASRDKFVYAAWENARLCAQSGSATLSTRVAPEATGPQDVVLFGLHVQGDTVHAVVTGDTILVAQQAYGVDYIAGEGIFSSESFTVEYVITTTLGQETQCVAVLSK